MFYSAANLVYEIGTVQTVTSEFLLSCTFLALFEHKQVSHGLESNKQESLYNKHLIELACSVRIGKIWSRSFCCKFMDH